MIGNFLAGAGDPGSQRVPANWIVDVFMLDLDKSRRALALVGALPWGNEFALAVGDALSRHDKPIAGDLARWLMLALQTNRGSTSDVLDILLAEGEWGPDIALRLHVFEDRTVPLFVPAPSFAGITASRLDVGLPGHERWLTEAWAKVFVPALEEHLEEIQPSVDQQLVRVYRAHAVLDLGYDVLCYRRSAIEQHQQDSFRDTVDVLIDAARECIEHALISTPDIASRYIREWAGREQAIFKRLSVLAYRLREDVLPDAKLMWLEEMGWLWEPYLHHEVFLLLQVVVPSASPGVVERLVSKVVAGPPREERGEYRQRSAYDLLGWLDKVAPGISSIGSALRELQLAHPDWDQDANAEFRHFTTSGVVSYDSPMPTEEFAELVQASPSRAIARLKQLETDDSRPSGTTRAGIRNLIRTYVASSPAGGLAIAGELEKDDRETMGAIIEGWQDATLDEETASKVISAIDEWPVDLVRAPAARMLVVDCQPSFRWYSLRTALDLARKLWPEGDLEGLVRDDSDLVTEAINHPAGDLASFWRQAVQFRWSESGETWAGIPPELRTALERMLSTGGRSGVLAEVILGGNLRFYYSADSSWTSGHLLPLFHWQGGTPAALGAWQGFLTFGRPDDGLLEAGLLNDYLEVSSHADRFSESLQRQLNSHLVEIALLGSPDPRTWLRDFVVGSEETTRCGWVRELDTRLERMEPEQVVLQWNRWFSEYWTMRSNFLPVPLGPRRGV